VAVAGLFALAITAFAQSTGEQQVVVPAAKATVLQRTYMAPGDFARYKGQYDLSNGKTLYLERKATRLYARVDQQSTHEITPLARGKFRSLDGNSMAMHLVIADDETVSGELSYIDESQRPVAGMAPQVTRIRFASR
jgi:hypothetical protein